jgi:hypothetical protein
VLDLFKTYVELQLFAMSKMFLKVFPFISTMTRPPLVAALMGKNHQGGKLQVWFYDENTWKL